MDKSVEMENLICDSYCENGLIEISKKRYDNLKQEREKYRRLVKTIEIVCVLIILFFSLIILAGYNFTATWITQTNDIISTYVEANQQLTNEYSIQNEKITELKDELAQLQERIAFLSLSAAMYESSQQNVVEEEIAENVSDILVPTNILVPTDWKLFVNLFTVGQKVPLPVDIDTNTFRCMDYRTITDKTSYQYKTQLLSQTECSSGLRYYSHNGNKYYTVALATAYGIDLGNIYKVTLENGTTFNIIHAEYKHDIRYPRLDDYGDEDVNYDGEATISVIEFIYDEKVAPAQLISDGEANRWLGEGCDIYGNGCNIKSMECLGKIWTVT